MSWGLVEAQEVHIENTFCERVLFHTPCGGQMRRPALPCVPGVTLGGRGVASPGRNHMRRALEFYASFEISSVALIPVTCHIVECSPANTLGICAHQEPPTALEVLQQRYVEDFPGGPVVGSPPASAGDTCLIPGSGELLMPSGPSAATTEPASCNYCSLCALDLTCHKRSRSNEKPTHHS